MKWAFWISAAFVAYTYLGYPVWLWMRAKWRPWPVLRGAIAPAVSVVMVVRDEAEVLGEKLRNLLTLDYAGELQLVVVSDGSVDGTEEILREAARDPRAQVMLNQLPRGKACGVNDGVSQAAGDIVVFTDARQRIEPRAVRLLVENFADPAVGAVSGELMLGDGTSESSRGIGLYWRMEKYVRELESASGSVVGATGALYAVRRELIEEIPEGAILDDVLIPMHVARKGYRVVFDTRARAWDRDQGAGYEFQRKVRTLGGNYQLLRSAPWVMSGEDPLLFEFVCHKLLRLAVPLALVVLLATSGFAAGMFCRVAFWMQVAAYALALVGFAGWKPGPASGLTDAARAFVTLNAAAVVALAGFVTGNKTEWSKGPRRREEMHA